MADSAEGTSKRNMILVVVVGVIVLGMIAGGGYLAYQSMRGEQQPSEAPAKPKGGTK